MVIDTRATRGTAGRYLLVVPAANLTGLGQHEQASTFFTKHENKFFSVVNNPPRGALYV
jgi:hypothetical protein